ncbi:MAG TPA: hypothetical protein VK487_06265 [Candidatus Bathyarchaeia archaeon]|nr:hypothetical protein [Candidatus Bathyarchaeia archaeon]
MREVIANQWPFHKKGGKIGKMENEEINPFVIVGVVAKMKIQDLGRLEEYIRNLHGAELVYVQKCPKNRKLRIVKESGEGEFENDRNGSS